MPNKKSRERNIKLAEDLNTLDRRLTKPLIEISTIIVEIAGDKENDCMDRTTFLNLLSAAASMCCIDIFETGIKIMSYLKKNKGVTDENYKAFLATIELFIKEILSDQVLVGFKECIQMYSKGTLSNTVNLIKKLKETAPEIGDICDENISRLNKDEKNMKKYKNKRIFKRKIKRSENDGRLFSSHIN